MVFETFVPFNTPSSKNSKNATSKGVFHSATVRKYLQKLGIQHYSPSKKTVKEYKTRFNIFRPCFQGFEKPTGLIYVGFHFVRDSKRKFDYINAMQVLFDLMTAHDFIEDDNCDYVVPFIFKKGDEHYTVDKANAGCYIKITDEPI